MRQSSTGGCYLYVRKRFFAPCRFWCKLASLSADGGPSPCMPVLVATFQMLLNEAEPELEAHLHSVGFSPVDCAVRWMVWGFVDVLDVEEVHASYLPFARCLSPPRCCMQPAWHAVALLPHTLLR
jgi:hypothetical protein